ncbi:MAG: hypothetical protein OIN86_09580 [Candidatus Methanoperedens sp.]|nr:hypothetical protein [Candidatus Methanoperedens sp.]
MIKVHLNVALQVKDSRERLERGCSPCGACKPVHGCVKSLLDCERGIKLSFGVLPSLMPSGHLILRDHVVRLLRGIPVRVDER